MADTNAVAQRRVYVPRGVTELAFGATPSGPEVHRGSTAHFSVSYDSTLGSDGITLADAILSVCEANYTTLETDFSGVAIPNLPFNIHITTDNQGAYHYSCNGVDLYIGARSAPISNLPFLRSLMVAEGDEVFMAAFGHGWNCGYSNGEGLSRVLANAMYPGAEPADFVSAPVWLDTAGRPNFVSRTDKTDQNYISIGCAVLFLNWMHTQLGHSWSQIIAAGGPTLAKTYANLTGHSNGLTLFKKLLQKHFPAGHPSGLTTDNPFPLS